MIGTEMTIATSLGEFWPATTLRHAWTRVADGASSRVRLTAICSIGLIIACFAVATILQMQRDYAHTLAIAEDYTSAQAQDLANETARALDRLAKLGVAFVTAVDGASASAFIETTDSDRILNIALADADGNFVSAMKGYPLAASPISETVLDRARFGPTIEPYSDPAIGSSPLTLVFQPDREIPPRFVVMPLDPGALLPQSTLGETALFAPDGLALALGNGWEAPPPAFVLRTQEGGETTLRYVAYNETRRIVALAPVPGWPLAAASSMRVTAILDTWYGSLPLYLFVILGPAIAGAGLAVLLVREFERADRARSALVAVKAIGEARSRQPPSSRETELALRLTEAEHRVEEAEQARAEFVTHMSHDFRTPLNAIVGFAEMIQAGFFGPVGHDKYIEYASDIASAGRNLHGRIGEILDYAAIEAGRYLPQLAPMELSPLLKECVEQAQGVAFGRHIALLCEVPELPAAYADATAVRRVMTLLVANALRCTADGGTILIRARKQENTLLVEVRDGSDQAAPDASSPAKHPFARFSDAGVEDHSFGLGLAIATKLARQMGGALRLAGATGENIWAELRLPMDRGSTEIDLATSAASAS